MPVLLGLMTIFGVVLYWIYRVNSAVDTVNDLDGKTQGLQRHARNIGLDLFGTRLQRVRDPRLAATILMIQLVRTGAVTAAERTTIMELMERDLNIAKIQATYVRAWGYTEQNRVFSPIANELVPLLRDKLTIAERGQLIDMLTMVANAYSEASELQVEAIARLKRRLLAPLTTDADTRFW